jgi:cbb3-type cytochrome c oxidase subunit III
MDLLLLATEAVETTEGGGDGLLSAPGATLAVVVLLVGLAAFALAFFLVGPGKRRQGAKRRGDIPLAARPYHSDEELETVGLERAMSWGVALAVFSALFLPLYWLVEPARINDKIDEFYAEQTHEGQGLFQANCATCHDASLSGGTAPNPYAPGAPWPAPALNDVAVRYADSEIVTDLRHFLRETIKQGRPGTPMPPWGAAYAGPLNDTQVDAIVEYILSVQVSELDADMFVGASADELWTGNCARCHGDNLQGQVGPQLLNLYERYGATPGDDENAYEAVRELIRGTVLNGRYVPAGPIMPSFSHTLSDDQIATLIEYIESQQQTGGPRYGQLGGDPSPSEEE